MKVILLEEIASLGEVGKIVEVANGYANNFLIPQKKALLANIRNLKALEHQKQIVKNKLAKVKKVSEKLVKKIESISCTISKQSGEEDKIFGSVTSMDIEEALKAENIKIDRKNILLEKPIKTLGVYSVPIKLQADVSANLKLWVVGD